MTYPSLTSHRRGFTLVELLVVIAIMCILMVLIVPASISMVKASSLTGSANAIRDGLSGARQVALSRNKEVEVRFYQVGSPTNADDKQYRAFRAFLSNGADPSKAEPLSAIKYLSGPVIITGDGKYSSLLDYGNSNRSGLVHRSEDLPSGSASYVSFNFRADGETSLKPVALPTGNWFLTLYAQNAAKDSSTGLPDNYCTVQLDPVTGRIRTYRP